MKKWIIALIAFGSVLSAALIGLAVWFARRDRSEEPDVELPLDCEEDPAEEP